MTYQYAITYTSQCTDQRIAPDMTRIDETLESKKDRDDCHVKNVLHGLIKDSVTCREKV